MSTPNDQPDALSAAAARIDELWLSIEHAQRVSAIEYFIAAVPGRDDYEPDLDGVPSIDVERLAKRLHMRPAFLLKDRRRAAKMLEQYGHRSFGTSFTLRVARALLKQKYSTESAIAEPSILEVVGEYTRPGGDPDKARQWLATTRRDMPSECPTNIWELIIRTARADPGWQILITQLLEPSPTAGADSERENSAYFGTQSDIVEEVGGPEQELIENLEENNDSLEQRSLVDSSGTSWERAREAPTVEESGSASDAGSEGSRIDAAEGADVVPAPFGALLDEVDEPEPSKPAFREPLHRLTGLDRAIMDLILATATATPGAQGPEDVLKACDEWSRLSTHRVQSYYCLGLAHGLFDYEANGFERPEMNEARNAWYAAGRVAAIQRRQDRGAMIEFLAAQSKPLAALLGSQRAEPQEGTRGAARQFLRQSVNFLAELDCWGTIASITRCAGPYVDLLILEDLYRHTSDLVATRRHLEGEALLQVVLSAEVPCPGELRARFRRRRAQVLAQQGNLTGAIEEFEDLTVCGFPDVEARAVIDLSLLQAGLTSAAQIRLPEGKPNRRLMQSKYESVVDSVRFALTVIPSDSGAVARADGLSFLAVVGYLGWAGYGAGAARPTTEETLRAVEAALLAIPKAGVENQYRIGGTLGLLLTAESVLCFERGDISRAMSAWGRVPHETGRLPLDDLHALVEAAVIVDPPSAEAIVDSILRHRPSSEVREPDEEWLVASGNFRRQHIETIDELILTADARLKCYEKLLRAARRANDREVALRSLDAIYGLGIHEGQAEAVLLILAQQKAWDGLWTRAEANEALADVCARRGNKSGALRYLEDSFEAAYLDGDTDYARALLDRMEELGIEKSEYEKRSARLPSIENETAGLRRMIEKYVGRTIRLTFVGGDERQQQYDGELRTKLASEFGALIEVTFIHPGWSSNWGRSVDDVVKTCESRDAVIIMRLVRTMMGRTVRGAVTKPWVSCAGHGKKAIYLSILKAAEVVVKERARSTGAM